MTNLCECGKLHYSLDHYFTVHGDYLGDVREHRRQVPILPNGKIFDPSKLKDNEEYPDIIYKWVCKTCGNFNTTANPDSHKKNCEFIKYLEFRKTVPYKRTVTTATTPSYSESSTTSSTSTPETTTSPEQEKERLAQEQAERERIAKELRELKIEIGILPLNDKEVQQLFKAENKTEAEQVRTEATARINEKEKPDIFYTPPASRPTSPLPFESDNKPWIRDGNNWTNVAIDFQQHPEYIQEWINNKFDYETAKEWINIFSPTNSERIKKAGFCAWMRDVKKKDAGWLLNHGDQGALETEYKASKSTN